jgi:alpha-L-fucosidase
METRQITRLKEMGDWLKKYGESIYSTKGGPYAPNDQFTTTRKGKKIYIHLLEKKTGVLRLPVISGVMIQKAYFMNGGNLAFKQDPSGYSIELPDTLPDPISSVIVLEADRELNYDK